ncbi:hypothetical protein FACS1894110_24900 [Spirochaetia bacterium]|nr:hypothetical protein FACS1894110_24900 [Spirochaetia bacterium]
MLLFQKPLLAVLLYGVGGGDKHKAAQATLRVASILSVIYTKDRLKVRRGDK